MADEILTNPQADEYTIIRKVKGVEVFNQTTDDVDQASYLLAEAQIAPFDFSDEEVRDLYPELSLGFSYYDNLAEEAGENGAASL